MTRDEIDILWQRAMTQAVKDGEMFTRYHFAALIAAAECESIAQMIEDAPTLMADAQNNEGGCLLCGFTPRLAAAAIRARGNA